MRTTGGAIAGLLILVGTALAPAEVILENALLNVTISPRGGRITSLKDLSTGDELVATSQGLCVDREWRTRCKAMEENDYTLRRIQGGVEASYTVADAKLAGLEYTKIYRLQAGSPVLHVALRLRNGGKAKLKIAPWVCSRPMAGGAADDSDSFFVPGRHGLGVVRLADAGKMASDSFFPDPRAGWIAVVDAKRRRGAMAFCEREKLDRFYLWCGKAPGTMEWVYRDVELRRGGEWQTTYSVAPIRGVAGVAGASANVVASLRLQADEAAQRILLTLSSSTGLGKVTARVRMAAADVAGTEGDLALGKTLALNWPSGKAEGGTLRVSVQAGETSEEIVIPVADDGTPRLARIGRAPLAKRGGPERFHIASQPLGTPHVTWAKPLPRGPLRALCLVPIPSLRDMDELAQRLDMDLDLLGFQHPLMDRAATEQFTELLGAKAYDLIVLSRVPMGLLPVETQDLLVDRVANGAGLLSVNTNATLKTGALINLTESGAFLETALPLHLLPDGCRPRVNVGSSGKGRCAKVSYAKGVCALTPQVAITEVDYRDWECYFQLLCRAALWLARRDTGVTLTNVWPAATTRERMNDQWRTERVIKTAYANLLRESGAWQAAATEKAESVDTWRGYGARVTTADGKLRVTEANQSASRGFAAGRLPLDLDRTPILEVTVNSAKKWSLFVPDPHFEKAIATLQPVTAETGVKRYDLRTFDALRNQERATLCFETAGEGSALALDAMRFLTAEGETPAAADAQTQVGEAGKVTLRIRSDADREATVTAFYRGLDYYDSVETLERRVMLRKGTDTAVEFPIVNLCGERPHAVDLIVRDRDGRPLAFAVASYAVTSPVALAAVPVETTRGRRADETIAVVNVQNKGQEREAAVGIEIVDVNGQVIGTATQTVTVPAGNGEQRIVLPAVDSVMTPFVARLAVKGVQGVSLARREFPMAAFDAEKLFYRRGEEAVLVVDLLNTAGARDADARVALTDMYGRLITELARKVTIPSGPSRHRFTVPTGNSLTVLNRARLTVRDSKGVLLVRDAHVYLPEARPEWDDYLVSVSQFSVRNAYVRPHFGRLARDVGIEGMVIRRRDTVETLQQAAAVMHWGAAKTRAFGFNFKGKDKSHVRKPCLSDPAVRQRITDAYEELGVWLRRAGTLGLASLEDESELTGARYAPHDVCTSEHCMPRYRAWLENKYKTVGRLNEEWSTELGSFDEVQPVFHAKARTLTNPAPWVDWRTFMEHVWLDGLMLTRKGGKRTYPELRMAFSNSFGQMPFAGWNYETISPNVDMTIEYPTIIDRIGAPRDDGAFEEDTVGMSTVIRQKMDIRKSFMPPGSPAPGWIWYDRTEQGAEFKPWWMAFMGCKGSTPWGPVSLGVRPGAKSMSFWAFLHPRLAHTKSSVWLKSSLHDLTRGVGKIFVDYEQTFAPVAVLYSQPSDHLSWAWSDATKTFYPHTKSLYAWYFKSRVNVSRMLRELGATPRWIGTSQVDSGQLGDCKVLFLPCSLCLSDETLAGLRKFVTNGGTLVADIGTGAATPNGRPIAARKGVEDLFGITRTEVCRTIEPSALTANTSGAELPIPPGLRLGGRDAITARSAAAAHEDSTPAIVVHAVGKGRAIYLNGFLGYNLPSRELIRGILRVAAVAAPVRITSEGAEHMGYECATFRRGEITVLGVLRLREEAEPTVIKVGRPSHLYDVRNKAYLGSTDTARIDLTHRAAAVLALMPHQITGVQVRVAPATVKPGRSFELTARVQADAGTPGDHVLRVEVIDPAGVLSRAYTDNVLAVNGVFSREIQTALNEQLGTWRVAVTDVISGKTATTALDVRD